MLTTTTSSVRDHLRGPIARRGWIALAVCSLVLGLAACGDDDGGAGGERSEAGGTTTTTIAITDPEGIELAAALERGAKVDGYRRWDLAQSESEAEAPLSKGGATIELMRDGDDQVHKVRLSFDGRSEAVEVVSALIDGKHTVCQTMPGAPPQCGDGTGAQIDDMQKSIVYALGGVDFTRAPGPTTAGMATTCYEGVVAAGTAVGPDGQDPAGPLRVCVTDDGVLAAIYSHSGGEAVEYVLTAFDADFDRSLLTPAG